MTNNEKLEEIDIIHMNAHNNHSYCEDRIIEAILRNRKITILKLQHFNITENMVDILVMAIHSMNCPQAPSERDDIRK